MKISRRELIYLAGIWGVDLLAGCSSISRTVKRKPIIKTGSIETLVLDFDGTLTNIEKEAEPYVEGYRQGLGRELGLSQSEIETYWDEARAKILQNPEKYGWELEGIIVASATSDPIMTCYPITDEMLGKLGITLSQQERRDLLAKLYLENYPKMGESFKEGVNEFLSEVWNLFEGRIYIVTNSSTDKVKEKISHLYSNHSRIPVLGGAKKYIVVNDWKVVPETINVPGLDRPVYLRRKHYGEKLDQIMQEQNTDAFGITVVGDIWEMDLALPQFLGIKIGFTPRLTTLKFERDVVAGYKNGFIAESLEAVYKNLKEQSFPI